jgi:hypothetical protein
MLIFNFIVRLVLSRKMMGESLSIRSQLEVSIKFFVKKVAVLIIKNIITIESTFFPTGLIHYQMNLGCKTAKYLSAFNSDDPGSVTILLQDFMFPHQALASAFHLSESQIK